MYSLFRGELGSMKGICLLEGVTLFFNELLCNLSILKLCSMLTLCTWCVFLLFFNVLSILDHNKLFRISRVDYVAHEHIGQGRIPWNDVVTFCIVRRNIVQTYCR
jgi:hypothetical protein